MSRTALVTGATGFIGGKLVRRLLDAGWSVHVLRRNAAPLPPGVEAHVYAGGTDEVAAAVNAAGPDVIFHLASLYLADHRAEQVADLVASNVLLTAQLAEAASAAGTGVPLLNTGTAWQASGQQREEKAGYAPVNLYAATKQAGADLLRYYADARGLPALTLRLFDTYGPGDTRRKLVQLLVEAAQAGEPLGMSPGEQRIDLTHVDDAVGAFLVAAKRLLNADAGAFEDFYVSGDRLSVRELAGRVGEALGRDVPARFGERPYRPREVMEPVAAAPLLPGWSPSVTLSEGIRALAGMGAR